VQSLASQRLCGFSAKSACRRPLIAMLELTSTPENTNETVRGAGEWTMARPTPARGHARPPARGHARHPRPALREGYSLNRHLAQGKV
jgi:hypothetical protein